MLLFIMVRKLLSQCSSASLALFSSVFRRHVKNASMQIHVCSKHAACSNFCLVFYRSHSHFRTNISTVVAGTFNGDTRAQRTARVVLTDRSHFNQNRTCNMMWSRKFGSADDTLSRDSEESWPLYTADWSKNELLMCTCCGFWDYRPDGANVIVSYIDTAASIHRMQRRQMPTALVVPSGMSEHIELKPLLELMVKSGWRIVIPDVVGMKMFSL